MMSTLAAGRSTVQGMKMFVGNAIHNISIKTHTRDMLGVYTINDILLSRLRVKMRELYRSRFSTNVSKT